MLGLHTTNTTSRPATLLELLSGFFGGFPQFWWLLGGPAGGGSSRINGLAFVAIFFT